MGAVAELGSRAIRGFFYEALEQAQTLAWIEAISNLFTSDQESEIYKWLTQSPVMREWVSGRQAKAFTTNGITIANKAFEATIQIELKDLQRDKTDQIRMRMAELVGRTNTHWASLISTLLLNGTTGLAYDGQAYFSASHVEGKSGTMSNLLTSSDVSSLNVATATAPTPAELASALMDVIVYMFRYKDDQGEPRNEDAVAFQVQCPISLSAAMTTAVTKELLNAGTGTVQNPLSGGRFKIDVVPNARLTWTDKFCVLRADAAAKPLIRQTEKEVTLKMKAETSDFEFDNDAWQIGVDARRNVGYGMYWQAILATLS